MGFDECIHTFEVKNGPIITKLGKYPKNDGVTSKFQQMVLREANR